MSHHDSWVYLSASVGSESNSTCYYFDDSKLLQDRLTNICNPSELQQDLPRPFFLTRQKVAVLIIGQLRCLSRSAPFFNALAKYADLFVVTTSDYAENCKQIRQIKNFLCVDQIDENSLIENNLKVASMKQWFKISLALKLVREQEKKQSYKYVLRFATNLI